jgi:hypothetical protein
LTCLAFLLVRDVLRVCMSPWEGQEQPTSEAR